MALPIAYWRTLNERPAWRISSRIWFRRRFLAFLPSSSSLSFSCISRRREPSGPPRSPDRADLSPDINENLIVELYSK